MLLHTKFQDEDTNLLVCPIMSHMSTRITDGNYLKKLLPVCPETRQENMWIKYTRMAIAKLFAL